MWVLTSFFVLMTFALAWLCAGYFVALRFAGILRRRPAVTPSMPENELPFLSIIVPCYNEIDGIEAKLANLLACDYPSHRREIIFADGGSPDGTADALDRLIPADDAVRVVRCPRSGKVQQLNHVLPRLTGDIIVNTDADAAVRPDALRRMVEAFAADETVAVVGAYSHSTGSSWRDRCFWDSQNRSRLIETDAQSSSIVIATCYAFQRGLFERFPDDVVADDVYVGFLANSLGKRVVYSREAIVEETRGPRSISEFLSHKFRKNNAFLRESLRFIYCLPDMSGFCKLMTLTRISQQLLLPWAAMFWSLLALTLLTMGRFDLLLMAVASLALSIMIAKQAFQSVDVPPGTSKRYGLFREGLVFLETIFVLFAAALSYPFFRQGSCYARLGQPSAGDVPQESGRRPTEPSHEDRHGPVPVTPDYGEPEIAVGVLSGAGA